MINLGNGSSLLLPGSMRDRCTPAALRWHDANTISRVVCVKRTQSGRQPFQRNAYVPELRSRCLKTLSFSMITALMRRWPQ
jgi:hypothetical protein